MSKEAAPHFPATSRRVLLSCSMWTAGAPAKGTFAVHNSSCELASAEIHQAQTSVDHVDTFAKRILARPFLKRAKTSRTSVECFM